MSKFKSEKMIHGRPERERVEDFCGRFVESGNRMHAYRLAYAPDPAATTQWVWDQVRQLEKDPEVAARIQQMRDEANTGQIVTVQGLLQDWVDIASADPNELISMHIDCCRCCNGVGHAYQWINEAEYVRALENWQRACAAAEDSGKPPGVPIPMPDIAGGYGFRPDNPPIWSCPECFGRGVQRPVVHDTRNVSPQARKLYAGIKVTKDGVEVKMHDQMKAREQLARIMGYFKDGAIPVVAVGQPGQRTTSDNPAEDPQQAYLKLIG